MNRYDPVIEEEINKGKWWLKPDIAEPKTREEMIRYRQLRYDEKFSDS